MPTIPRLPVSVCMIAAAEAPRIRRALDSIKDWAGEIIVVINDDVADGTDAIASAAGAKVFREPWKGHIAQKNSAVQKAAQEWIFGLDADEVVTPELHAEIAAAIARPESAAAYNVPRCTFYCGRWIRHGDWYPDRKVRLWRRGHGSWGGIDPHDAVAVAGRTGSLKSDLLHYGMENLNHRIRKATAYSDIFAQQRLAGGKTTGLMGMWFRPWWRFARSFFLRRGFLDGWQGYVIARMIAFETFLRHAKVREGRAEKTSR